MSSYTISVLFGQRIESYSGQYAPEVLAAMDEFGMEENPEYIAEKHEEYAKTKEFSALRVISIKVSFDAIESALNAAPEIKGEVSQ